MTADEAKECIRNKTIVEFIWGDPVNKWGILTCLSDDESGAYYKLRGCGLFSYFAGLSQILIPERTS